MESLSNYAGRELIWAPARTAKRTYELRVDDHILATLSQPSAWRQNRVAVSADGRWSFARVGFFRQRLVIADADTGAEVASMSSQDWKRQGTLTMPDGRRYEWRNGSFWGSKWAWLDESGQPVMHFKQFGSFRLQCAVVIEPQAASDPRLTFLAALGWYLMLLAHQDSVVAATAATTAATSAAH